MTYKFLRRMVLILPLLLLLSCETVKKTYEVISDPSVRVGDRLDQPSTYLLSIYATNRININLYSEDEDYEDENHEDEDENFEDEDESFEDEDESFEDEDEDFEDEDEDFEDSDDFSEKSNSEGEQDYSDSEDLEKTKYSSEENTIFEEKDETDNQSTPVLIRIFQLSEKSLFLSASYDDLNEDNFETALGKTYIDHEELMIDPNQFRFFGEEKLEEKVRYLGVVAYFNDEKNRQWRDLVKVQSKGEIYPLLIRVTENKINLYKDN